MHNVVSLGTIGLALGRLTSLLVIASLLAVSSAAVLAAQGTPVDGAPSIGDPYVPGEGNAGYDVTQYDLSLKIEPKRRMVRGTASIELVPTDTLRSFTLDLAGFDVSAVEVDGVRADFERPQRKLRITPARPLPDGQEVVVRVTYAGRPQPTARTGWLWFEKGGALVSTQTNGASTLFPCNDHPSDTATFAFDLTTPRGTLGIANGLLERRSKAGKRTNRFEWSEPEPFPTYAAVVAVGRFRLEQRSAADGLPVVNTFPRKAALQDEAFRGAKPGQIRKQFQRQGEIVSVLERAFGPYPYSSIGAIVVPLTTSGPEALEAATRPTYPNVRDVVQDKDFEQLVAHEIAHQWFGNAVALTTWRDMWLNEGFATYGELLWIAEKRDVGIGSLFGRNSNVFGYYPDMARPAGDPGPAHLFSVTVYNRGALTLEALRRTVGDVPFYEILRAYFSEHRGGHATTEDFIRLAESISGEELDTFFQRWLYEQGLPDLPPEQDGA